MQRERVAVGEVIDAVAEEFHVLASPLRLDVAVDDDLEVDADAARLHQVIANLVTNAARHGGSSVEIRADVGRTWW